MDQGVRLFGIVSCSGHSISRCRYSPVGVLNYHLTTVVVEHFMPNTTEKGNLIVLLKWK